jgi:hypothetical protein
MMGEDEKMTTAAVKDDPAIGGDNAPTPTPTAAPAKPVDVASPYDPRPSRVAGACATLLIMARWGSSIHRPSPPSLASRSPRARSRRATGK